MDEKRPKKYAPKKVFILENNEYIEITYEELCKRTKLNSEYASKLFLPLHGMLMEVTENVYREFYKEEERQKYLKRRAEEKGETSYDMLTTDELNGESLLVDLSLSVEAVVEKKIMIEKLHKSLSLLTEEEWNLVEAIFFRGISERQWSSLSGIPLKTVNRQKHRILSRLKKIIEKL